MRKILTANDGKVLTNGEIYGKVIYLAEDANERGFYEISEEEYEKEMQQNESNFI